MYLLYCYVLSFHSYTYVQLEPYRGVAFYSYAHQAKTGKSKSAKAIPKPTAPGIESERHTLEETQGYSGLCCIICMINKRKLFCSKCIIIHICYPVYVFLSNMVYVKPVSATHTHDFV